MAASSRTRSGAASTVLVIVRWRHSPAIPITPSSRMKRLRSRPVNSSRTSSSVKSSASVAVEPTTSSDSASADADERDERPRRAELEQLGAAAAAHCSPPVSAKNAVSSERARGARPVSATCASSGDRADPLGLVAEHEQAVALALDLVPGCSSARASRVGVLRAHLGGGALVAAEHLLERAAAAQLAVGDDRPRRRRTGRPRPAGGSRRAPRGRWPPARAAARASS